MSDFVGRGAPPSGAERQGERRLVTALFADVSGFTSLAERLDPETLVEIIDPIIASLTRVATDLGGYVSGFAGDAIVCLFGAPVSREDDASRALLAALRMREELERLRPSLPAEARHLTLHIGVNTGHVVATHFGSETRADYSALGDPVNLAQRLEAAAPPGEIFLGRSTHDLTRARFETEPVGDLVLKGKSEPVPAWRLVREHRWTAAREPAPLVGRRSEMSALERALGALARGRGATVAVTGEPGIGKSRLAQEFRRHPPAAGIRWIEAGCPSYGAGVAYLPYSEMLREVAGAAADDPTAVMGEKLTSALESLGVDGEAPYLGTLLGLHSAESADLTPDAFRRRLHEAFSSLVKALGERSPIVIAIDDFHWTDHSSAALTVELASLCASLPLVIWLTARPEGIESMERVLGAAPEDARCSLDLAPLSEADAAALVDGLLGGAAPPELAELVVERAAGNPLFIEELIAALREAGVVSEGAEGWRMRSEWDGRSVPPTIEGLIAARIDRLPRGTANLLGLAAVVGREVLVPLLRAVAQGEDGSTERIEELVSSGFLDPGADPDVLWFHHPLVLEVAYGRLLRRRRRELHGRVADAVEQLWGTGDEVVDLLARHRYLGGAGVEALDVLVRAGGRARRIYANDEAILHFERAAEVARDAPDRWPEVAFALAELREIHGDYEAGGALYEEVRQRTNDQRAWWGLISILLKRGEFPAALEMVSAALAQTDAPHRDIAALHELRARALSHTGRYAEATEALRKGLEAAGGRRDLVVGRILVEAAFAEIEGGDFSPALRDATEARAIFEDLGYLRGMTSAAGALAAACHGLGRLDEAAEHLRRGLRHAERTGVVEDLAGSLLNLGAVELDRGRLEEAIACDRRAIAEFERVGNEYGRAIGYGNLAEKLRRAGTATEARECCERALEVARSIGRPRTIADATHTSASIRLLEELPLKAAEEAEEAARLYTEMGLASDAGDCLRLAADALERAGRHEDARDLRERSDHGAPTPIPPV